MPHDIGLYILARLKYMMQTKYNTKLISSSWNDSVDCLRYFIYFKVKKPNLVLIKEQLSNYNPDYIVKRPQ